MDRTGKARLASGPGGPRSQVGTRMAQRVASAAGVHSACASLIADGLMPSIRLACEAGAGFSETTLNRRMYKPILWAAKKRFEAVASGCDVTERDAFGRMGESISNGIWDMATARRLSADATDQSALDDDDADPTVAVADDATDAGRADTSAELSTLDPAVLASIISKLRKDNDKLVQHVQRRDDQLYHALGVAHARGETIERQRSTIRELKAEIETLSAEPLPTRAPRDWKIDDGE